MRAQQLLHLIRLVPGYDHDAPRRRYGARGVEYMLHHRETARAMQHLGVAGAHARPQSRCQNHDGCIHARLLFLRCPCCARFIATAPSTLGSCRIFSFDRSPEVRSKSVASTSQPRDCSFSRSFSTG